MKTNTKSQVQVLMIFRAHHTTESYEELAGLVRAFRLDHPHLPTDEVDKLILRQFRIGKEVLWEIDGLKDLLDFGSE